MSKITFDTTPLRSKWVECLYEDLSQELRDYLREAQPRYEHDLAIINSFLQNGQLLELGSYPYCMSYFLRCLGFSVTGLDIKVSRANKLLNRHQINVLECDIEKESFPFVGQSFDLVVCNEVIEHLRINPLHTLAEIKRCLKRDGILMLTTPNLYGVTMLLRFLSGKGIEDPVAAFKKYEKTGHMGHLRTYAKHDIQNMLNESGFEVVAYTNRPLLTGSLRKIARKQLLYKFIPAALHDNHVFIARLMER